MDQGLRITVGNDMYYDQSQPRSPRDNPRNRLAARMEPKRYEDRIDDSYRRRSPPHRDEHRQWAPDSSYGRHPLPDRPKDPYTSPGSNRYDSAHGHHPDPHWSSQGEQKTTYDPDLHQKYPAQRSPSPLARGRSPYRRRTPSPYRSYANVRRRSHSRSHSQSPLRNQSHLRSPNRGRHPLGEQSHSRSPNRGRPPMGEQIHSRSPNRGRLSMGEQSHSRSPNRGRPPMGEDILSSMYSSTLDSAQPGGSIHAKGGLDKLRESYDKNEAGYFGERKYSKRGAADDEEAYLYGDDRNASRYQKEPMKREYFAAAPKAPELAVNAPVTSKPAKKEAVTPGGFDTNALKNVLKAIGFDFELSAQSLQKAATGKDASKSVPPIPKPAQTKHLIPEQTASEPPPIVVQPSALAQPHSEGIYQNPFQQAMQAGQFLPQNLQGQDPAYLFSQAAALQYPPNIPIPASVAPQVIYQPLSYMQPPLTVPASIPERPNLRVIPTIALEEKEKKATIKSAKTLAEEKKVRKKRLDYLEVELKNLKKKQAELTRKKRKQLNNSDHEQMKENSMLQAGVVKQIKQIREAAEKAAGIRSASSDSGSEDSSGSSSDSEENEISYIDSGNHYCRDCNVTTNTLPEFLNHLHSKGHKKVMDPDYKPWYKKISFKDKDDGPTTPIKGSQFMLPINGFYCKLCKTYSGDTASATEHCRTLNHNLNYVKFCKKNPDYAKEKRSADIQHVADRLKKLKEGQKLQQEIEKKNRGAYAKLQQEIEKKNLGAYAKPGNPPDYSSKKGKQEMKEKFYKNEAQEEKYFKNEQKDKYFEEEKRFYKHPPKEEKYFNDRKMKDPYSSMPEYPADNGYKRREIGPEPPSKSGHHDKYFADDGSGGSRSSSRMRDQSPLRSKDPKIRDFRYDSYEKGYIKPEESYKSQRSGDIQQVYKSQRSGDIQQKRPHSPWHGPYHDDRVEGDKFYKVPNKKRYEEPNLKMRDEKKNGKQRKARWSPGYDELEERRENNESRNKDEKKTKPPASSFGKFTWKKVEKGKMKKDAAEPTTGDNENKKNDKFSLKLDSKGANVATRSLRSRSGFGTFAPHTKVMSSLKEGPPPAKPTPQQENKVKLMPRRVKPSDGDRRKSWDKNLPKKPVQISPSQPETPVLPAAKQIVSLERRRSYEPPPPGTEDIFEADEGSLSDVSGISMELGSDNEP